MCNSNIKRKMKRLCFLLLMAFPIFVQAQNKDWANIRRYDASNKEIVQQPNDGKRVVFLGNSITEGWVEKHGEFFTNNGYIGRGISGQTSYQFLVRFREDVINLHPKLVIINAGTNDVAENTGPYNADNTFGNIVSMVELAKANKIKVILTSILPAAGFGWNKSITDAPEKIQAMNKRIEAYAKANKIPYVNYYDALVEGNGLPKKYSKDGVHPTVEGYEVMEAMIQIAIKKVVK